MGPWQVSDHVVQDRQTGEQMTHWDKLSKATKFEFSLFQYIAVRHLPFVPRDRSAAKGPFAPF